MFGGRAEDAVAYAEAAIALEADPRLRRLRHRVGRHERGQRPSLRRARWIASWRSAPISPASRDWRASSAWVGCSSGSRRSGDADEALVDRRGGRDRGARASATRSGSRTRYYGYGRSFTHADPARARRILREGLDYAIEHRLRYFEAIIAREAAGLEAVHGNLEEALSLLDAAIERFQQAGADATLSQSLAYLAVVFDRCARPEIAATVYGASASNAGIHAVIDLPDALAHLRAALGDAAFDAVRRRRRGHGAGRRRRLRPRSDPTCARQPEPDA